MDNRRKHRRFTAAIAAEVEVDGELLEGETHDVSASGVSVLIEESIEEGLRLSVTLLLTEDGIESADLESVTTQATVMWVAPTDRGACMVGLRFAALPPRDSVRLQHFLAALAENHRAS